MEFHGALGRNGRDLSAAGAGQLPFLTIESRESCMGAAFALVVRTVGSEGGGGSIAVSMLWLAFSYVLFARYLAAEQLPFHTSAPLRNMKVSLDA